MDQTNQAWDVLILDGWPPVTTLGSLAAGDVDGDGNVEMITGGEGGLLWYRPATSERGWIAEGRYGVGVALEDLDGDGLPEVVTGGRGDDSAAIRWFKPGKDPGKLWIAHDLDPAAAGGPHDLIFVDIDGDGERELLANAIGGPASGLFLYKRGKDPAAPWKRHAVEEGYFEEGLAAADLDGDGRIEIVHGPDVYFCPPGGPFSGPWQRGIYAPSFREMVRVAVVDITGNGRPDIVIAESEFLEGRMSWFENRLIESPDRPWIEHPIDGRLYYAHSMQARRDGKSGEVRVFVAEMAEGGWSAPRNRDARLIEYRTADRGKTWRRDILYQGCGTHQAFFFDVDGDGQEEVLGKQWRPPKVHLFKRRRQPSPLMRFRHQFIDRDKPETGTDIVAADIDGDGRPDVACGQWWYQNPTWQRREIAGYEVLNAFDVDGDGREELIATKRAPNASRWISGLTSELYWLKAIDAAGGKWEAHAIGTGSGDWPHGTAIGPILPGGGLALVAGYHSARKGHFPEIFAAGQDPTRPWSKSILAEIPYGEEMLICDIEGNGRLDIIAGTWWLESLGDGSFRPHQLAEDFASARTAVADVNGDGRLDIILGGEVLDFANKVTPRSRLVWLAQPADPRAGAWPMHVIDSVRCPHSIGAADLDGDGQMEIVCGEHDPFHPYRNRCRLLVYKQADPAGRAWWRYTLDDRFEHHDGCRIFEVRPGQIGILSHGWKDKKYVHLWTPQP